MDRYNESKPPSPPFNSGTSELQELLFPEKLLEYFPGIFYIRDTDYNLISISPGVDKKFGLSSEEILGKKCYEVFQHSGWSCPDECPGNVLLTSSEQDEISTRTVISNIPYTGVMNLTIRPIPLSEEEYGLLFYLQEHKTGKRASETSEGEIEELYQELKLIDEINQATLKGETLAQITTRITEAYGKLVGSESLSVYFYDKQRHQLTLQKISIDPKKQQMIEKLVGRPLKDFVPILKEGSIFNRVIQTGQIFITSEPDEIVKIWEEFTNKDYLKKFIRPAMKILKIRTIGLIPITSREGTLALIKFQTRQEISSKLLKRLKRFGEQLAKTLIRIQSEEKLHKLSRAIDNISSAIMISGNQGEIEYVNAAFSEGLGLKSSEIIGKKLVEVLSSYIPPHFYKEIEECANKGKEWRGELSFQKGSLKKWLSIRVTPLKFESEEAPNLIWVIDDQTRHKMILEELKKSEEKYRKLFEETKDVVYLSSPEGRFIDINRAGVELFGYASKEEMLNIDIARDLYANPEDREKFIQIIAREGHVVDQEVELKTKNGQLLRVLLTATAARDQNGKIIGYHGIMRDITEKRQLEKQLLHSQKMEAIGTLAGGIAHDFNNVLAAILGYSELALMDAPHGSRLYKNLDEIYQAALRASQLVQQILTFSRQKEEERRPIQIHSIIKEALKLLRASLPATIEIKQNIPSNCGYVEANPTQIHQVIMNLCTNAYHAMRQKGGVLKVKLENVTIDEKIASISPNLQTGDYLKITVKDTGHGIDPEILDRIFEPFFTTKTPDEGTGMGLAMVHGIVMAHKGHIQVDSTPGKGTTFSIFLPIVPDAQVQRKQANYSVQRGNEHILLVDDERNIVEVDRQILENFGYKVTATTSSKEAINIFKKHFKDIDLVITDLTMPGMTGLELAAELKKICSEVPIILISGYNEMVSFENLKEAGIARFILKPFTAFQLSQTIREVITHRN